MQGITESTVQASPTNSHFNYTKLLSVFSEYANGGNCMDGKSFVKLAKDTGLLDRKLTIVKKRIVHVISHIAGWSLACSCFLFSSVKRYSEVVPGLA